MAAHGAGPFQLTGMLLRDCPGLRQGAADSSLVPARFRPSPPGKNGGRESPGDLLETAADFPAAGPCMSLAEPSAATPGIPAPVAPGARFIGDPRAYWRLLIRGSLLLAVTLG